MAPLSLKRKYRQEVEGGRRVMKKVTRMSTVSLLMGLHCSREGARRKKVMKTALMVRLETYD